VSKFNLTMDCDNASFEPDAGYEISRILHKIAIDVANGDTDGKVRDLNGDTVCQWEYLMSEIM
jgi:hypothetical protein